MIPAEHVRAAAQSAQQTIWTASVIPATVLSPRRFAAWIGIAAAMMLLRASVKLLPPAQPVRLFLEGFAASRPFRLRDVPGNVGLPITPGGGDGPSPCPAR